MTATFIVSHIIDSFVFLWFFYSTIFQSKVRRIQNIWLLSSHTDANFSKIKSILLRGSFSCNMLQYPTIDMLNPLFISHGHTYFYPLFCNICCNETQFLVSHWMCRFLWTAFIFKYVMLTSSSLSPSSNCLAHIFISINRLERYWGTRYTTNFIDHRGVSLVTSCLLFVSLVFICRETCIDK